MSNKLKVQRLQDTLLVGYARENPYKPPVLIIGRERMNKSVEIINAFEGKDAEELYNRLTTKIKKEDADG